jgi:hypothetical protein
VVAKNIMNAMICLLHLGMLHAQNKIEFTNLQANEVLRQKAVIVKGLCSKGTVRFKNLTTGLPFAVAPSEGGKFIAFVDLKKGKNKLQFSVGTQTRSIDVFYKPPTTPYRVEMDFVAASNEDPVYQIEEGKWGSDYILKLQTTAKVLQAVTAEMMREAGYGKKTFAFAEDKDGEPLVVLKRWKQTGNELRATSAEQVWGTFHQWLYDTSSYSTKKHCMLMAFTRFDRVSKKVSGSTALGGGMLGLFGSGSMFTWPATVDQVLPAFNDNRALPTDLFDDATRRRYGASCSTTMGAVLHELGHTFGLPHSTDDYCIMTRGFDGLYRQFSFFEFDQQRVQKNGEVVRWSDHWAAKLNLSPWFQPNGNKGKEFDNRVVPRFIRDGNKVTILSEKGLGLIGAWGGDGKPNWFKKFDGEKSHTIDLREISKSIQDKNITVHATDRECGGGAITVNL